MSSSNRPSAEEVVNAQIASLNACDIDALLGYYSKGCIIREQTLEGAEVKGHDELRAYLEELLGGLSEFSIDLRNVIASGNRAAVQMVVSGVHTGELYGFAPSGSEVSYRVSAIHTLEDGKTVLEEAYFDPAELTSGLTGGNRD